MVLHADESGPAVRVGGVQGLRELPCVHRGRAEVPHLARAHDVVQRFEGLFEWRAVVEAVDLVEVDVVGAEAAKAVVDLGHDRLAREARAVGTFPHHAVDLGGDHDLVTVRVLLQRASEELLTRPGGIHVRGVEEVDAGFDRGAVEGLARLLVERPRMTTELGLAVAHAPEADHRHVEARGSELGVLHGAPLTRTVRARPLRAGVGPRDRSVGSPPWRVRCAGGGASSTSETAACSGSPTASSR